MLLRIHPERPECFKKRRKQDASSEPDRVYSVRGVGKSAASQVHSPPSLSWCNLIAGLRSRGALHAAYPEREGAGQRNLFGVRLAQNVRFHRVGI